jgi:MFS family permease
MTPIDSKIAKPIAIARNRAAVSTIYFVLGAGFGSWVVRIPDIQRDHGLSTGSLGTALLAVAVGSITGMPLAGWMCARHDSAWITLGATALLAVTIGLIPVVPAFGALLAALLVLGIANGALGVAMNLQGAPFELAVGHPAMSSFHGIFSVGGLLGSLVGGVTTAANVSPTLHLSVAAAVLVAATLVAGPFLVRVPPQYGPRRLARPDRGTFALSALAFAVLFCEGAVTDWSAVYLGSEVGAAKGLVGAGYTVFAVAMAAGRLIGDGLSQRFGPRWLVYGAGLLVLAAASVIVLAQGVITVICGFGLLGVGLSVVFPCTLSAAARSRPANAGAAIASVSTFGYLGFLLGPPLIGYLSELTSLSTSLGALLIAGLGILALAHNLAPRTRERRRAGGRHRKRAVVAKR